MLRVLLQVDECPPLENVTEMAIDFDRVDGQVATQRGILQVNGHSRRPLRGGRVNSRPLPLSSVTQ